MKKTNLLKLIATSAFALPVLFLTSCNKDMKDKTAQTSAVNESVAATNPIADWEFDSSWKESVSNLTGTPHNGVKFSTTALAYSGASSFQSKDSGYVSYNKTGSKLPNLKTAFTVDFWLYAYPKEGGAQCVWCMPQTGAFWPTQHVLLDGYNSAQKDSGLIKVMFKANRDITYNEEWTTVGGIPKFYNRWTHVQYSYSSTNSQFTLIVNGKKRFQDTLFTNDPAMGGQPLGTFEPNPNPKGILMGTFQNIWDPTLFGDRQVWMLPFKGRIDQFKVYGKELLQ